MKLYLALCLALFVFAADRAGAQNAPNPAFLEKALTAMQSQRNNALDAQAVAEARLGLANEDLLKARSELAQAREDLKRLIEKHEPKPADPVK